MKKQFLLGLSLLAAIAQIEAVQPATIDLFTAIDRSDYELFTRALRDGADVNAVNVTNGCTPLMQAMVTDIENNIRLYMRKGLAIGSGFIAGGVGVVCGTIGSALYATQRHRNPNAGTALTLTGITISTGILSGIMGYKVCKELFSVTSLEKKIQHGQSIIYALCDHPGIDFSLKHHPSGKTVSMMIHAINAPTYLDSLGNITIKFTALSVPYHIEIATYQTFAPFYQKLSQHLYEAHGVVSISGVHS